jgi:hypothetical protein
MKSFGKWMLAAAVVASGLGMGAAKANAAQIGIYVRAGRPAIPPSPGPGYVWVDGYYDVYGAFVPGYWNYAGVSTYAPAGGVYFGYRGGDRDRYWDHERRDHERREHEWREHEYRDHDRGEHRGWDHDRR